jgi:5-methylcytosine-specific restriction enzyme subunit McrC
VAGLTIYEFDAIVPERAGTGGNTVPAVVYDWLDQECHRIVEGSQSRWLRPSRWKGQRAVQVTSFVGVIRAPNGYQIEVLPKIGRSANEPPERTRQRLIEMLRCLNGFRHIQTANAQLAAVRMPLLEVFVSEFLRSASGLVKRGLKSAYVAECGQLFALRGKLLPSEHLRKNLCRGDRFFTEHDDYSQDRPENRLIHSALRSVLSFTNDNSNERLARELVFAFSDVPESAQIARDFQKVQVDRGMGHYSDALAWARLILDDKAPLTGLGGNSAPSLLFPMEAVFEAYVAKHLSKQLIAPALLKTQLQSEYLVKHLQKNWFRMRPDLVIKNSGKTTLVLDTKWKIIDKRKSSGSDKYQLSQSDFYQVFAYGHHYLAGTGAVALIYPKVEHFDTPLPVFEFPKSDGLRLWVLPFCLDQKRLLLPDDLSLSQVFEG